MILSISLLFFCSCLVGWLVACLLSCVYLVQFRFFPLFARIYSIFLFSVWLRFHFHELKRIKKMNAVFCWSLNKTTTTTMIPKCIEIYSVYAWVCLCVVWSHQTIFLRASDSLFVPMIWFISLFCASPSFCASCHNFFSLGISIPARFFHSHFVINLKFTKWKQLRSENIQTKKYIKLHHRKKRNPKRLCSSHSPLRIPRWRSFIPSSSIVLLCLDFLRFVFGSRSILFLIFYFFFFNIPYILQCLRCKRLKQENSSR